MTRRQVGTVGRQVWCLGLLAALVCAQPRPAHGFFGKVGSEFQINTYTPGNHSYPRVESDSSGGFLVVWADYQAPRSDVDGQRYTSSGATVGTEFQVNTYTGFAYGPALAFSSAGPGAFLVVWSDFRNPEGDIFGQIVVGSSPAVPGDTKLNTDTNNDRDSDVAILNDGSGVIVWDTGSGDGDLRGVFAQRRSSLGSPLGTEFQVNTYTVGYQFLPKVASLTDGGFTVVWESEHQGGAEAGIFGQRYDSTGGRFGTEFQVNTYTPGGDYEPAVASDPNGGFVVVWKESSSGYAVRGQRYDSAGAARGTEFTVASSTHQVYSVDVTSDSTGGFVIVWGIAGQSNPDVQGQRYDSGGSPLGTQFAVSNNTGARGQPSVAADVSGGFVVTWVEYSSQHAIVGQRFADTSLCPDTPASGCRTAGKSLLIIKNDADDTKDKLIWKWLKGQSTTEMEFGDPTTTRTYALCVYDSSGRLLAAEVPPDATKWANLSYKDSSGAAAGIQKIILKPGASNDAKILVKGKGANLPDPTLGSLPTPITVQMVNSETSLCFEGTYNASDVIKNDATQLKAKSES